MARRFQPARLRDDLGVEPRERAQEGLRRVARGGERAGLRRERAREFRVGEQARQRAGQRLSSRGATSSALSPSATISGTPPTAVAATGTPAAIASSKAYGEPSL